MILALISPKAEELARAARNFPGCTTLRGRDWFDNINHACASVTIRYRVIFLDITLLGERALDNIPFLSEEFERPEIILIGNPEHEARIKKGRLGKFILKANMATELPSLLEKIDL